jgi:hypothetical protein
MQTASRVRPMALAVALALASVCAAATHSATAAVSHTFSVYTRAGQGQFVDKSDDRTRGEGQNPFGDFSDTYSISQSEAKGPYPGDETSFTLNVYGDATLRSRVGIAIFSCQYNITKNAFCDATFQILGGTLIADGQLDFNASKFSLAVIGGTGSYANVSVGTLVASPGALHAEHVIFQLQ